MPSVAPASSSRLATIGKVKKPWFTTRFWVSERETDSAPDRAISQIFVIRAQRCIGYCPLAVGIDDSLVVLPIVRVRGIVHPNLEVLGAREEKVAIIGELAGIASRAVMDDFISLRRR